MVHTTMNPWGGEVPGSYAPFSMASEIEVAALHGAGRNFTEIDGPFR